MTPPRYGAAAALGHGWKVGQDSGGREEIDQVGSRRRLSAPADDQRLSDDSAYGVLDGSRREICGRRRRRWRIGKSRGDSQGFGRLLGRDSGAKIYREDFCFSEFVWACEFPSVGRVWVCVVRLFVLLGKKEGRRETLCKL